MNTISEPPKIEFLCDEGLEFSVPNIGEVIDRLGVMRKQEDTTYVCSDYLELATSPSMINELCRTKMLEWCFQVTEFGKFKRDTVVMAMSYLDLFLSSGSTRAIDSIKTRREFQLASMTTLYMALKLFEPVELKTSVFATLSQNTYTAKNFAEMEFDILSDLNWRVNRPTVLSFLEQFFALIPTRLARNDMVMKSLEYICKQYTELTLSDYYFVTQKPSTIAIAVLSTSLQHISLDFIDETDRRSLFLEISNALRVELSCLSQDILLAQKRLASKSDELSCIEPESAHAMSCEIGKNSTTSSSNTPPSSSPICVAK